MKRHIRCQIVLDGLVDHAPRNPEPCGTGDSVHISPRNDIDLFSPWTFAAECDLNVSSFLFVRRCVSMLFHAACWTVLCNNEPLPGLYPICSFQANPIDPAAVLTQWSPHGLMGCWALRLYCLLYLRHEHKSPLTTLLSLNLHYTCALALQLWLTTLLR